MLFAIVEYGMGNEVLSNGDIYNYGILLLEMFIVKRPIDNMFKDNLNLHDFVKGVVLLERMIDIVDPTKKKIVKQGQMLQSKLNWMSQNSKVLDFDI